MPVGHLLEPLGLLDRFCSNDNPVRTGGDEIVDRLGIPYPSADLGGDVVLPDYPLEDGDVVLLAEGTVQVDEVQIRGTLLDPHAGDREGIGHDDLLASRNASDELDHLMVHDIDRGDHPHARSSANDMKFSRTLLPETLLFSGWNCVP